MADWAQWLNDVHFLRPLWLLALIPILLAARWLRRHPRNTSRWGLAIEPKLLPYLLVGGEKGESRFGYQLFIVATLLTCIALAGPVWKKIPQPVHKSEDALVILLDLSLSMLATDQTPSRLIKAQHKLLDILSQRQQGQTALIAYAGDANVVAPLTDDTDTIKALVPALSPLIMPALGSQPTLALARAEELLQEGAIAQGRILLITDGISSSDVELLSERLARSAHELAILVLGTEEGAPIPIPEQGFLKENAQIVIAKTQLRPLTELARQTGARLAQLQLDDGDIRYLLPPDHLGLQGPTREVEREFDTWQEEGPKLVLILVPLAALAFRRGWLLCFCFILLLPPPALALSWADLWQTPDQQGAKALAENDPQGAAELFARPDWRGSAAYQAGDYEGAAQHFAQQQDAQSHYNRGNALAKSGKLQEALAAYDEALKQAPNLEDATFNRQLIEQLLQQQNQQNQEQQNQEGQQQESNPDNSKGGAPQDKENGEDNSSSSASDESNSSGPEHSQNQTSSESASEKDAGNEKQEPQAEDKQQQASADEQEESAEAQSSTAQNADKGEETESNAQAQAAAELSEEQRQATEQWLRRIPDDPGALLKRKFEYQYRQRQLENQFQPPRDDQPIW